MYGTNIANVKEGDWVQLHPATDRWMRGDRFGVVVKVLPIGTKPHERVRIRMDRSGDLVLMHPANVQPA